MKASQEAEAEAGAGRKAGEVVEVEGPASVAPDGVAPAEAVAWSWAAPVEGVDKLVAS